MSENMVRFIGRKGSPEWPRDLLRSENVTSDWAPIPVSEIILKVHSRCNLACDYCYMYEMADQSWQGKPIRMKPEVLEQMARRVAEHVETHQVNKVSFVFHGGEPLLSGRSFLEYAAIALRDALPSTQVDLAIQTNGLLLSEEMLDMLLEQNIKVGVSLDGGEGAQDRHRRDRRGRGSYQRVAESLERLTSDRYRRLFAGLLCTIDLDNDPVETYESLLEFGPPRVDFLLPHGNWSEPPPRRTLDSLEVPYADWLFEIFERWYKAPELETGVRFLGEILLLLLGGQSTVESIGLSPVSLLVIETDGSFEQVDTLKSTYQGATATGFNVFDHRIDDLLHHPEIVARQLRKNGLSATCQQCPVVDVCGGGYYPHRYRAGDGFLNPSVYCPDLFSLISRIRDRLLKDLATLSANLSSELKTQQ